MFNTFWDISLFPIAAEVDTSDEPCFKYPTSIFFQIGQGITIPMGRSGIRWALTVVWDLFICLSVCTFLPLHLYVPFNFHYSAIISLSIIYIPISHKTSLSVLCTYYSLFSFDISFSLALLLAMSYLHHTSLFHFARCFSSALTLCLRFLLHPSFTISFATFLPSCRISSLTSLFRSWFLVFFPHSLILLLLSYLSGIHI